MNRTTIRQMRLPFLRENVWNELPQDNRRECRELLSRLLAEVVRAEPQTRRTGDEPREDHPGTS
jgi:hypothetical protein